MGGFLAGGAAGFPAIAGAAAVPCRKEEGDTIAGVALGGAVVSGVRYAIFPDPHAVP